MGTHFHICGFTGAGDVLTTVSIGFARFQKAGNKQASSAADYWPGLSLIPAGDQHAMGALFSSYIQQSSVTACSNFIVMQTLFMCRFYSRRVGLRCPDHEARFTTTPSRSGYAQAAAVAFIAYLLNQRYGSGDALDVRAVGPRW